LAEVGSEASDAESPYFEDVVGGEAAQEATSGAGKALLEEKEKKEDPDTTSSENGRNQNPRSMLVKSLPGRSLARSKW